jgi:hypothetical protein
MEPTLLQDDPTAQLVEQLLSLRIVNVQPVVQALYPSDAPKTASAKFHNKRQRVRYHKFSTDELRRLLEILSVQLQPIAQVYPQLLECLTNPPSKPPS